MFYRTHPSAPQINTHIHIHVRLRFLCCHRRNFNEFSTCQSEYFNRGQTRKCDHRPATGDRRPATSSYSPYMCACLRCGPSRFGGAGILHHRPCARCHQGQPRPLAAAARESTSRQRIMPGKNRKWRCGAGQTDRTAALCSRARLLIAVSADTSRTRSYLRASRFVARHYERYCGVCYWCIYIYNGYDHTIVSDDCARARSDLFPARAHASTAIVFGVAAWTRACVYRTKVVRCVTHRTQWAVAKLVISWIRFRRYFVY